MFIKITDQYVLKILTAGDGAVGKTTLLNRYISGKFLDNTKMTLGVEIFTKTMEIDENTVTLQLWDFGGQEQFRFMLESYVYGASGGIIMFDQTRFSTVASLDEWVQMCRKPNPKLPLILLGSKVDLVDDSILSNEKIQELKKKHNFLAFLNTSSKTGLNVDEAFQFLVKEILTYQ